jgi:spore coat protein U-like protein
MTATVTMRERRSAGGTSFYETGTTYTMDAAQAAEYVQKGFATYVTRPAGAPVPALLVTDANNNVTGLMGPETLIDLSQSPNLFDADCIPSSLTVAKAAIAANACTVAFVGDSVTEDGNCIDNVRNYRGNYRSVVIEALALSFPACTFTMRNYGLSSRTGANFISGSYTGQASGPEVIATGFYRTSADHPNWGDGTGSVSDKSWIDHVEDSEPHLLIVAFGLNPQMDDGIFAHLDGIKTAIAGWSTVPSVVLVPPMRPHTSYQDQRRAQAIARIYREYAKRNAWSFIDVNRMHNMLRDGVDESSGLWQADNSHLMTWDNWQLISGTMTQNDDYTITLGANSFVALNIDSHDVSVQVTSILGDTDNTGVMLMRARDESVLAESGTFPQSSFLRASKLSLQLWDPTAQVGSSYGFTPDGAGDIFRFDIVGARYEAYINGVLRNSAVSYKNMRAGRVVVGAFGGTTGGMVLKNPKVMYRNPAQGLKMLTDADILGSPYSGSDFSTRYPYGGNGANHPSSIGVQRLYGPPVSALISALRS